VDALCQIVGYSSSSFICKHKYNDSKLVRVQDQQGLKSTYGDSKKEKKKTPLNMKHNQSTFRHTQGADIQ